VNWLGAIDKTVTGLGYELVDCERAQRGLLRVFIDRAGDAAGGAITIDDCEAVTRQLQYVLEVEGVAYERLEVSSPGLDRPLKKEADYARFAGQEIELTLKLPFNGRKKYRGLLQGDAADGWQLVFNDGKVDQVLDFSLEEVREARLVPVVNFKGRAATAPARVAPAAPANVDVDGDRIQ
jgi:ribosome maturation factor RimP